MDTIFEKQSTDKTGRGDTDDIDRSTEVVRHGKTSIIDKGRTEPNLANNIAKAKVSVRRDLCRRDAMGRKIDELERPLTNQAKSTPGPANYIDKYSVLYPHVSTPSMIEPFNLGKEYGKKMHFPLYNVRKQMLWVSKRFTLKGRDFTKENKTYPVGPADYFVKYYPKTIGPTLSGRSKSIATFNISPGPKYNIRNSKGNGPSFTLTGKQKFSVNCLDYPSPAHYEIKESKRIKGGLLSRRLNNKMLGENCSPGPIYKPNVPTLKRVPTIKGGYKSPYTHSSRSPGPQAYYVRYYKGERAASYSLTPKPFPETYKDKFPGPANYGQKEAKRKNLGPTLKGKFKEIKSTILKPGPADYNINENSIGRSAIITNRLKGINEINSNPSPNLYEIDTTLGNGPAFSIGSKRSLNREKVDGPGPASYYPKQIGSMKKITLKSRQTSILNMLNCSPGPIYYPKDIGYSKNIIGASLSSRHSPWVYSPIKRF
ncbi:unnamed protein product [Dimorphilus gyrociliatus]|uniref:Uncharacterized protein n=1 Tax=Dimorphilus gyrociliatus TaxID=2664684 RepID=A0A7I8VY80_9ANNE|nr:unnamed protein product [Dimorphilus gyrociliatus]